MGLCRVWLQTLSDGLVRADQITGIDAHQTPALTGKPARWLLDVVLAVPTGSGRRDDWTVTALHGTVIQTENDPSPAAPALARLLAQLNVINAAGIISSSPVAERGARSESTNAQDRGRNSGRRWGAATVHPVRRARTRQAHRRGVPLNASCPAAVLVPGQRTRRS
jgi:hypothetical protein